ncbi:helix-turn-helix domain-containing protein [Peptostreptococcus porci]|uniref:helix-turn-helix domain-containing protein n=1 Tax=Peptostreptococcus porci TaxID=2652282 RepID=UPI002A915BF3|nr:helix-turn-helix domain-containing protein [Peptostreptococcus porci]MDY5435596.1 helix-turn-helix domain-containing protein [Peptostreptococcus porci]
MYALLSEGHSISYIAKKLNRSRNTIYNEIKRDSVQQIKQNRKVIIYFPERGQTAYEEARKNSRRKLKLQDCKPLISFVEDKFVNAKW